MRNICNIDFRDLTRNGSYNSACGCNDLLLEINPSKTQLTNYKVEITDTSGTIHTSEVLTATNELIRYEVPIEYWNKQGTMKVRLLSDEGNSSYISFSCLEFDSTNNVYFIYSNGVYTLRIKTNNTVENIPIATTSELGGVIVGETLSITEEGLLNIGDDIRGEKGDDGITPTIGDNGNWYLGITDTGKPSRGEKGEQGIQGIQGIQGVKGDTGEKGETGPQGPKGEQGETGPQGEKGDVGGITYSTSEKWTGCYDSSGRKIYSMYMGEYDATNKTGTVDSFIKTFSAELNDVWLDMDMSIICLLRSDSSFEFKPIISPSSTSTYVIESLCYLSSNRKTLTIRHIFGTSLGSFRHKYIKPYIKYTYK